MSKIAELSIDELNAEILALSQQKDAIIAQARELTVHRDRRLAAEAAAAKVAAMSPDERAALAQAISAQGISAR